MPPKRRPQSPAETANIQNLAKRQKSENGNEVGTGVETKLGSAITTPSPSLINEEWSIGLPLPASRIPLGFLPSTKTQVQVVTELSDDRKAEAIKEWMASEYKFRPRFSRLLCLETLQENNKLLAAYLGFDTVPQLYYFVHFQGKEFL